MCWHKYSRERSQEVWSRNWESVRRGEEGCVCVHTSVCRALCVYANTVHEGEEKDYGLWWCEFECLPAFLKTRRVRIRASCLCYMWTTVSVHLCVRVYVCMCLCICACVYVYEHVPALLCLIEWVKVFVMKGCFSPLLVFYRGLTGAGVVWRLRVCRALEWSSRDCQSSATSPTLWLQHPASESNTSAITPRMQLVSSGSHHLIPFVQMIKN